MDDALNAVCEKMIRRHPHVLPIPRFILSRMYFQLGSHQKEKLIKTESHSDGIPRYLPALLRAESRVKLVKWDLIGMTSAAHLLNSRKRLKSLSSCRIRQQDQITAEMGDCF